jgi:GTP-dependent dephospho-CoA kinase
LRRVYRLPEDLRSKLAEPMGRVYSSEEASGPDFAGLARRAPMVVTVGDRVTETLEQVGRTPDVHVIDGVERRSRREPPKVPFARLVEVKNPAGTLTQAAVQGMRKAFAGKKPVRVKVEGEEDLMAMLAVVMAPMSALVFYGQPGVGVVAVKVNSSSKTRSRAILAKMGIKSLRSPSS